ncbi:DUF2079 domain-containing protein [Elusimicrobiota bacterium]
MLISIARYILVPLFGFFIAGSLYYRLSKRKHEINLPFEKNHAIYLGILSMVFFAVLFSMSFIRYDSCNATIYDLGAYIGWIWRISAAQGLINTLKACIEGHFTPVLFVYGVIYKICPCPGFLLFLQSAAIVSSVIPLYLFTRDYFLGEKELSITPHLTSPTRGEENREGARDVCRDNRAKTIGFLFCCAFFLYPPVAFNAIFDFHPDHLVIPILFWAVYLAHKNNFIGSVIIASLLILVKEPFILVFSFFGAYLALRHKKRLLGASIFIAGMIFFCIVVFRVIPLALSSAAQPVAEVVNADKANNVFDAPSVGFLGSWSKVIFGLFKPYKPVYLFTVLGPLAFLALLAPLELIAGFPLIMISMVSPIKLHCAPSSHYTAGLIAPVFTASIIGLSKLIERKRITKPKVVPLLLSLCVLCFFFSLGNSPLPISIAFWSKTWGHGWSKHSYSYKRTGLVREAEKLISDDPRKIVVSQNNLVTRKLAQRYEFSHFPNLPDRAHYVFLDIKRDKWAGDKINEQEYDDNLSYLRSNPAYELIFSKDGVLLFKRK